MLKKNKKIFQIPLACLRTGDYTTKPIGEFSRFLFREHQTFTQLLYYERETAMKKTIVTKISVKIGGGGLSK
jgi:hypothetical protein